MQLRVFVRLFKQTIDDTIRGSGYSGYITNEERESWVMNDEGLYLTAKDEGVTNI